MVRLSLVLMTYNEEKRMAKCLDAVEGIWDELLVVDCFSTDGTENIARVYNAKVLKHEWQGYIKQRAFCVQNAKYDVVLALDADELVSESLKQEILGVKENWQADGYRFKRIEYFEGKPIRYGGWRPSYKLRLFDRRKVICAGIPPHDVVEPLPEAKIKHLNYFLHHHSGNSKETYDQKIKSFARSRAKYLMSTGKQYSWFKSFFQPVLRFLTSYIYKLGFLDGWRGFQLAKLEAKEVALRQRYMRTDHSDT